MRFGAVWWRVETRRNKARLIRVARNMILAGIPRHAIAVALSLSREDVDAIEVTS